MTPSDLMGIGLFLAMIIGFLAVKYNWKMVDYF